jgi:type I restriction enzyme S subunit
VRNIGFGVLKADKLEFLPPARAEEHKRHKLREGDIVFGRKGAVERHLLVSPSEQGWIQGSDCIRLRVVSGPLTPRYLSVRFREEDHQRWMMNQCSGGATMASLNQDILCRIPLVVPAFEHLAAFDQFCASTLNQMDVLSSQIQNLRRTRDLLLPRLLSGQVAPLLP